MATIEALIGADGDRRCIKGKGIRVHQGQNLSGGYVPVPGTDPIAPTLGTWFTDPSLATADGTLYHGRDGGHEA